MAVNLFNIVARLLDKLPRRRKLRFWHRIVCETILQAASRPIDFYARDVYFLTAELYFCRAARFLNLFPLISHSNKSFCAVKSSALLWTEHTLDLQIGDIFVIYCFWLNKIASWAEIILKLLPADIIFFNLIKEGFNILFKKGSRKLVRMKLKGRQDFI